MGIGRPLRVQQTSTTSQRDVTNDSVVETAHAVIAAADRHPAQHPAHPVRHPPAQVTAVTSPGTEAVAGTAAVNARTEAESAAAFGAAAPLSVCTAGAAAASGIGIGMQTAATLASSIVTATVRTTVSSGGILRVMLSGLTGAASTAQAGGGTAPQITGGVTTPQSSSGAVIAVTAQSSGSAAQGTGTTAQNSSGIAPSGTRDVAQDSSSTARSAGSATAVQTASGAAPELLPTVHSAMTTWASSSAARERPSWQVPDLCHANASCMQLWCTVVTHVWCVHFLVR